MGKADRLSDWSLAPERGHDLTQRSPACVERHSYLLPFPSHGIDEEGERGCPWEVTFHECECLLGVFSVNLHPNFDPPTVSPSTGIMGTHCFTRLSFL